ncbi:hypothetical protein Tco_0582350, partial [Tanacetum coccineum]
YVAVYFCILYMRHRAGIVTDEMLTIPKRCFAVIGMLEALGVVTGMLCSTETGTAKGYEDDTGTGNGKN